MIPREKALVISFPTGTDATAADRYCNAHKIPARIIPLPPQIASSCGLALKAAPDQESELPLRLSDAGIRWESARVMMV